MSIARLVRNVLSIALALTLVPRAFATPPAVFTNKPLEEVKMAARESGKMLLVDFTASWCGPCKRMDRTTWVDPEVVAWIGDKAIAVQIDVDKDPETSKALGVESMPTVIVFRGGEVFDRAVGYQAPVELLGWLRGVAEGRRRIDAVRAAAEVQGAEGKVDVERKLDLARALAQAGKKDEATEAYVWLWEHMLEHDPAFYGVRLSFMRSDLEQLAKSHPAARDRFASMRDATRKRMDADPKDTEAAVDWQALCQVVGDKKAVLAWFDAARNDPDRSEQLERIGDDLTELLVGAGRWSDAGKMVEEPVQQAERHLEMLSMERGGPAPDMPEEYRKAMQESLVRFVADGNATLHACCLAAGRDMAAQRIAALTFKACDAGATRTQFVRVALKARQSRLEMRAWLDDAAAKGEDVTLLRERLTAALQKSPASAEGGNPEPAR